MVATPEAAASRLAPLLRRLSGLPTRSRKAGELRTRLERGFLEITGAGGIRAAGRAIAALNAGGRRLVPVDTRGPLRSWREDLAGGRRVLEVRLAVTQLYRSALVSYRAAVRPVRLTPRQRRRHALQEAFYARYMAVGRKAYADPPRRVAPSDRLVLVVGELEADVNNGGFSQYLHNKGRRRARGAVAALRAVGAHRTARLLESALDPRTSEVGLAALDDRFHEAPEDLAALTARHVGIRPL